MNYPKVLYKGEHYDDYMQMGRDVHSNKLEHRYVASEAEETQATEDGFGPLGNFIGQPDTVVAGDFVTTQGSAPVERMKRRGRPPKDKA